MIYIRLATLLLMSIVSSTFAGTYDDLRKYLLENYDPVSYPEVIDSKANNISYKMTLIQIDINEEMQTLVTSSWISLKWKDTRLSWDDRPEFANVTQVSLKENEVWIPDLPVYADASRNPLEIKRDVDILAYSDGSIIWVQPRTLETYCTLDFLSWPLDRHTCMIKMGHWTQSARVLDLKPNKQVDVTYFSGGNGWTIETSAVERKEAFYDCCTDPYVSIEITFTLQRSSCTFASFVIAPAIIISLMLLFQFIMPSHHAGRIMVCCCCAVLTALELAFIRFQLPMVHSSMPYIVGYYLQLLVVNLLGFLVSFISLRKYTLGDYK